MNDPPNRRRGNTMMRKTAYLLLGLLVVGFPAMTQDAPPIASSVVAEIISTRGVTTDYIAFLHPLPITPEDILSPYAPNPIPEDIDRLPHLDPYEIETPKWFVWIDLAPGARYEHPVLFVLIDIEDDSYAVREERWWPVLNGVSLWVDSAAYWSDRAWIASSLSFSAPVGEGRAPCEPERLGSDFFDWALVVNGWAPGEPDEAGFENDAAGLCSALGDLGMRVTVLDPGEANPNAIEHFFAHLFTDLPLYTCCDRLYIYLTCHASPGALWIGGERLSSGELARMLTLPGDTYVPSRVYVLLECGYAASFIPDLSCHSNIYRVWAASAADEPAYSDIDPVDDPNPEDCGGEWTSSFLATLERLISGDPLAVQAAEFGREYMPLNMAFGQAPALNVASLMDLSHPNRYLASDLDPARTLEELAYVARWARLYHIQAGTLEETIDRYKENPCGEFLWFLHYTARHDALPVPNRDFNQRTGKQYAKDLANSDWWAVCDLFWEIFTTPIDGE